MLASENIVRWPFGLDMHLHDHDVPNVRHAVALSLEDGVPLVGDGPHCVRALHGNRHLELRAANDGDDLVVV